MTFSNIAEVNEGEEWNDAQCAQCGNPIIDGEGIGPEGSLCTDCWLTDDIEPCEICGVFTPREEMVGEPPTCRDCDPYS